MIFLRIAALLAMTKPTWATISTGNEGMTAVREMTSSYPVGMAKNRGDELHTDFRV